MTKHRTYDPLVWNEGRVRFLDQTLLPHEISYTETTRFEDIVSAIGCLAVRGAPMIGIAGAYAVVLASAQAGDDLPAFHRAMTTIERARPTAVNLKHAVDRLRIIADRVQGVSQVRTDRLLEEAYCIHEEARQADRLLARHGADLVDRRVSVLTICNTGPLATGGEGTAFGVITELHHRGHLERVYACETRPLMQGARLTIWEFQQAGVDPILVQDSAAGTLLSKGMVDMIFVGADRIAANGDTANKIGTYTLAVLAARHQVPFYVVAPESTLDPMIPDGSGVPIEERSGDEITTLRGIQIAPVGTSAYSPAFDTTPSDLISGIITEKTVYRKPFDFGAWGEIPQGSGTP